jgi:hypothetical protein
MTDNRKSIRIAHTKRGQKIAFEWTRSREFRIPLAEAELLIASGGAGEVVIGPDLLKAGVKITNKEQIGNSEYVYTAYE